MSDFGEILQGKGYILYEDPSFGTFYQKCIETHELVRRYYIEIHQYDFGKFKENGSYDGERFRYDVRMSFHQKCGDYLEIRYGIHDFNYRDELVDIIERKCEKLFTDNDGKNYEEMVKDPI